ncbi:4'-phosphopantetheinyl transferase family protein [Hahella sp. NBU794]|uniref:4'-phosphopantetheinyl transferase family protein n=1 Tax=Hahella sp. NBU794 TaxID=3422590 RepID=UPI003D6F1540
MPQAEPAASHPRLHSGKLPTSDWNRSLMVGPWRLHAVSVKNWRSHFETEADLRRVFDLRERRHLRQIHFAKRKLEWGAGRLAGKQALQRLQAELAQPQRALRDIIISNCKTDPYQGRPEANMEGYVSISHAGDWAVATAGRCPVGVDIEPVRAFCGSVWEMAFTPEEQRWLLRRGRNERDASATMTWAFKEALLKCYGRSIFGWFADVELHSPGDTGALSWTLSRRLSRELGAVANTPLVAIADRFQGCALVVVGSPPEICDLLRGS